MKQIRSALAIALTAIIVGCQAAPVHTAALPVSQSTAATPAAAPVAESTRGRTLLVLALLVGLVAAAVIIGASSDGDGGY